MVEMRDPALYPRGISSTAASSRIAKDRRDSGATPYNVHKSNREVRIEIC